MTSSGHASAWLAAFSAYQLGNYAQAVYWARLSIPFGLFQGNGAHVPRIGFRHPSALYEGPFDILRFALRKLGDQLGAGEAERLYHQAAAARGALAGAPADGCHAAAAAQPEDSGIRRR